MKYEILRVVITKERKHDGVGKPLVTLNTLDEITELKTYLSDVWSKEIKKVGPSDKIEISFTILDKDEKDEKKLIYEKDE